MRVLLVYCHPSPESYTAAVREAAIRGLSSAGHEVRVTDLYAEKFGPVMSRAEREVYHTAGANEAGIAAELASLRWAEALVLVYPTWWYGQPAMLKGWLDRVWVPHATFGMPEPGKPISRVLTNIRRIVAITSLGSPKWWWMVVGQPGRRILLSGIGALCHPRAKKIWLALHDIDSADAAARNTFLQRVEQRMAAL
jgi:NAD(P)H dehydrogenase (quinone)